MVEPNVGLPVSSPATATEDERTMAVLAHALQVVGGWIAPLVIFIVKRQSRFVSFHSLQVLFLHLIFLVIYAGLAVFWIAGILLTVSRAHGTNNMPPAVFLLFPLAWLGFMGMWVLTIVLAVVYAIKAGRGEWAEYPILGRWVRSVLKIGPNGTPAAAIIFKTLALRSRKTQPRRIRSHHSPNADTLVA